MRLQEKTESDPRIDSETRTLRGVAILNRQSKNNRCYSDKALDDCAGLAEGARVFFDHRSGREPHSVRNLVGVLRNVQHVAGRVKGDLAVLGGRAWEWLQDVATRASGAVGLSIDAQGTLEGRIVTELSGLNSVDLVGSPASTSGLFESRQRHDSDERDMDMDENESLQEAWSGDDFGGATFAHSTGSEPARVSESELDEESESLLDALTGDDDDNF